MSNHRPDKLSKGDVAGVFIGVQSGNLLSLRAQPTFCEFLVRCLERLSDLLAAPFEEGVVCARGFEPVEVFADLAKGPVAQWLEQGTHNPLVAGSNPAGPTILIPPKNGHITVSLMGLK